MLKLPKSTVIHPHAAAIEILFTKTQRPMRPPHAVLATYWSLNDGLSRALKQAMATEQLIQGLEQIEKVLAKEAKGLQLLRQKTGQPEVSRLSRLLLLSNDGSERFYHKAESVLKAHAHRAWAVVIDVPSETLGKLTNPWGTPVKALLLADRRALEQFLAHLM